MKGFEQRFIIDYSGVDSSLRLTLPKFVDYLQEAAILHSQNAGYEMSWFSQMKRGWLILNWDVHILKYPQWNEEITVKTWPVSFDGILACRGFQVFNIQNELILDACSKWVFTNIEKKRPVKPPKGMCERYGLTFPAPFEYDFSFPNISENKMAAGYVDSWRLIAEKSLTVTHRDIDTNNHVNNISYIIWAIDCLPEFVYKEFKASRLKISYKKESVLAEQISIKLYQNGADKTELIAVAENQIGELLAEIYFN